MKASVTRRENEHPLVRAKVPFDFIKNLPLYAGASIGSSREFAVHLGSLLENDVSCRLSYRPNDAENLFGVAVKSNLAQWIAASTRATLSLSAELNLSKSFCPSFRVWIKPRNGDYSLCRSLTFVRDGFRSGYADVHGGLIELKEVSEGGRTVKLHPDHSAGSLVSNDHDCSVSLPGPHPAVLPNGVDARSYVGTEDQQSWGGGCVEKDTACTGANFTAESSWKGMHDLRMDQPQAMHDLRMEQPRQCAGDCFDSPRRPEDLNFLFPSQDEGKELGFRDTFKGFGRESSGGMRRSSSQRSFSGWNMRAHTSIPVGRAVMARVRWSVNLPSDFLQSFESGPFSFLKLPLLSFDKVTLESLNPIKKSWMPRFSRRHQGMKNEHYYREMPSSSSQWYNPSYRPDIRPEHTYNEMPESAHFDSQRRRPNTTYDHLRDDAPARGVDPYSLVKRDRKEVGFYTEMPDRSVDLEEVVAMCSAMKQQLNLLHAKNQVLMKSMDDLKDELSGKELCVCDPKIRPLRDYPKEDDNLVYFRLFGEILAKCDNLSKCTFLNNIQKIGKSYKESLLEDDKEGARFDSKGTVVDHSSETPENLRKAIIMLNGGS